MEDFAGLFCVFRKLFQINQLKAAVPFSCLIMKNLYGSVAYLVFQKTLGNYGKSVVVDNGV